VRAARKAAKPLYSILPDQDDNYMEQPGTTVTRVTLPSSNLESANIVYAFAKLLASGHSLDTPRGVGFHGNWYTTYGLMSVVQEDNMTCSGYYWYGTGRINGIIHLDLDGQMIILEYKWNQDDNKDIIGSRSRGDGLFVIPAGHEFFYGYWRDSGDMTISQNWCGTRISQDITESMRRGIGPFANAAGMNMHDRSRITHWGDRTGLGLGAGDPTGLGAVENAS
jgi:hypothetical protein